MYIDRSDIIGHHVRMYPYEPAVQRSLREIDLLRRGHAHLFTEFHQHLRGDRAHAKYRDAIALCQLWPDLGGQPLHRHGTGVERRAAEQFL